MKASPLMTNNITQRNILTFTEVWEEIFECTISKDKLYAECRAGNIPHTKIGTKLIFRRTTLENWFSQQEINNCK